MSTPHLYSDERVNLPTLEDSPNPDITNTKRELLADYADDKYKRDFQSVHSNFVKSLAEPHDYVTVRKSTSGATPWGNKLHFEPTSDATSVSHHNVVRNCEAAGYRVLNNPESHGTIEVFQPSPRRYYHFNSPHRDAANADLFIINYTKRPAADHHSLAIAGSKTTLQTVASSFAFDSFRPQHGHAYLTEDTSINAVKHTLDNYTLNYALHENHTGSIPLYESFSPTTHNTIITHYDSQNWTDSHAYHKYDSTNRKACCGAITAHDDHTRILTEETAATLIHNKPCGRSPCQLDDLDETTAVQDTL